MKIESSLSSASDIYPWQKRCLESWQENGTRGIVQAVTGTGKSRLALEAAIRLNEKYSDLLRVKIVVPTVNLALQWKRTIRIYVSEQSDIGFVGGGVRKIIDHDWTIYVINSARQKITADILRDMREGFHVFLIADECHHYGSPVNRKIFNFQNSHAYDPMLYHSMGLSATPHCENFQSVLTKRIGPLIYTYGLDGATADGTISNYAIYRVSLNFTNEELAEYENISNQIRILHFQFMEKHPYLTQSATEEFFYTLRRLAKEEGEGSVSDALFNAYLLRKRTCIMAKNRIRCVSRILKGIEGQVLIFCERIEQAEGLRAALANEGIPRIGMYHSKMTDSARKLSLERFRSHEDRILISCKALDEGLDVPDVATAIVMSGSSVGRQHIQRLGRILRVSPEKPIARLFYCYVWESSEESSYVSEDNTRVCNLKYLAGDDEIINETYLESAQILLDRYSAENKPPEMIRHISGILLSSQLSSDWLRSPEELRKCRESSLKTTDKNYFMVMEMLAKIRTKRS